MFGKKPFWVGRKQGKSGGERSKYLHPISDLLWDEDAEAVYKVARNLRERTLISLFWLTGARPGEVTILRRKDVEYSERSLKLTLRTLKRKKKDSTEFDVGFRNLEFLRRLGIQMNPYIETIIGLCEKLAPEDRLLPYTVRWAEKVTNRLGLAAIQKPLTPYHFRHSAITHFAAGGANLSELMHFKGAKSLESIKPYLHAIPMLIELKNKRRVSARANSEETNHLQGSETGQP